MATVDWRWGKPLGTESVISPHLQWEHGSLVGDVDVVPNAETGLVLGDDHVTLRDPLYVGTVGEEGGEALGLHVVEMEAKPPVTEQQLATCLIQLGAEETQSKTG